jgi:hypothetical protein
VLLISLTNSFKLGALQLQNHRYQMELQREQLRSPYSLKHLGVCRLSNFKDNIKKPVSPTSDFCSIWKGLFKLAPCACGAGDAAGRDDIWIIALQAKTVKKRIKVQVNSVDLRCNSVIAYHTTNCSRSSNVERKHGAGNRYCRGRRLTWSCKDWGMFQEGGMMVSTRKNGLMRTRRWIGQ